MTPLERAAQTVNDHVEGKESNDNKIRAAVGLLNQNSTNLLILAIANLGGRIATSGKDLGDVFEKQVDKTIESNKKLALSNNINAIVMAILTFALVGITFWQAYLANKTFKFQQGQAFKQILEDSRR